LRDEPKIRLWRPAEAVEWEWPLVRLALRPRRPAAGHAWGPPPASGQIAHPTTQPAPAKLPELPLGTAVLAE
jgi:hypothetical protein